MLIALLIWLAFVAVASLAHRLYSRRPLTAHDVACSRLDVELDSVRVEPVAERRAA